MELNSDIDFVQCRRCRGPMVLALDHPKAEMQGVGSGAEMACLCCDTQREGTEDELARVEASEKHWPEKEDKRAAGAWWRTKMREERAKLKRAMEGRW